MQSICSFGGIYILLANTVRSRAFAHPNLIKVHMWLKLNKQSSYFKDLDLCKTQTQCRTLSYMLIGDHILFSIVIVKKSPTKALATPHQSKSQCTAPGL